MRSRQNCAAAGFVGAACPTRMPSMGLAGDPKLWYRAMKSVELMIASSQSLRAGSSFVGAVGLLQGSTTPVPNDSVELLVLRQDCFKISHLGWQSSVTSYLPF